MINASSFQCSAYQVAAFYADLQFSAGSVLRKLLVEIGDVLDGDPITLPLPVDAPREVPRLFLVNKNQTLRMEVSPARVDVRWNRAPDGPATPLAEFIRFAEHAFGVFGATVHAPPGRLALVTTRYQLSDNPGLDLARHFCRPELLSNEPGRKGPLNRPEQFELHAFKQFGLGRFIVNSWVRSKSGQLETHQGARRIVLVEQDLNTPAEHLPTARFGEGDIREFHRLCGEEAEVIISLYFPG